MKAYSIMLAVFFAPLVFAAYCWGLHELVARFIVEPPLSYFLTGMFLLAQIGVVVIAGDTAINDY